VSASILAAQWDTDQVQFCLHAGVPIVDCDLRFAFQDAGDIVFLVHGVLSGKLAKHND